MSPYLIKNPTYQELEPVLWVRDNVVYACPFDGPKELEADFRKEINIFFWHVLQSSIYRAKKNTGDKFGETYVPFPYSFGQEKLPMVFGHSKSSTGPVAPSKKRLKGHFSRALDWLLVNVFEYTRHRSPKKGRVGKCREYRINAGVIACMYANEVPHSGRELLNEVRMYSPTKLLQERYSLTIMEQIEKSAKQAFKQRKHDLKTIDRNGNRETRKLYSKVLERLAPNELLVEPIIKFLEHHSLRKDKRSQAKFHQVRNLLWNIISGPIEIVDYSPLKIRYWPQYRVAKVGGRLFEIGGGFQNMPSKLKQECFSIGTNWDMKSSQLNILKHQFWTYGIACSFLDKIDSVNQIAEQIGESVALTKKCFYATVFSLGEIRHHTSSNVFSSLLAAHKGDVEATSQLLTKWLSNVEPLVAALKELQQVYERQAIKSKDRMCLECATGTRYYWPQKGPSQKDRRRILNHMVTGLESSYLFEAVLDAKQVRAVFSFEHDGALLFTMQNSLKSDNALFVRKKFSDALDFVEDDE